MIGLIRKNLKLDKLKKNNFKGQIDFQPRNLIQKLILGAGHQQFRIMYEN